MIYDKFLVHQLVGFWHIESAGRPTLLNLKVRSP
jgi:hypothetical protein